MNVLSSHAALWHNDRWYRRAWYIWPQTISLLLIGWLFVAPQTETTKPQPPWAKTKTPPKPQPPAKPTPPQGDETTCSQGNSPDALAACGRLIDAGRTGFYLSRAQIYFRNRAYDPAISDLSAFIRLNPNNVRALGDRGTSYEIKGEYDKAIADYSEAIRLAGKGSPLWVWYTNRGSAYEKKGELDKALADFREALNNGNTSASEDISRIERAIVKALNDRGLSYAKKDEYDRAIADYTEAISLDRGSALSYSNRGSAYEKKRRARQGTG